MAQLVGAETVTGTYLSMLWMTLIGIGMPLGAFITQYFVMPKVDSSRPHMTKSWLMEGYERDHSLYPRRLSTYECGSEPVGEAMIQFHFQYYWYAIIFLVFDVAFMFMALGGLLAMDATESSTADPIDGWNRNDCSNRLLCNNDSWSLARIQKARSNLHLR
ncbi:MAG: hypothetical protein CM15mP71_3830 [Candidatus Poseidoniales archaeon]|nr:MAG: hypothetical protein CM15mP71_3830 [Candidatus Poseidoniales archaeon]